MTESLERALRELQKLTAERQDAIAALILDEIADDRAWDNTFSHTHEALGRIAVRVRAEAQAGRVRDGGWDDL